jgi:hypothetical protein
MGIIPPIGGIPHTPEMVADSILLYLGKGNKCLNGWHFTFTKVDLLPWLQGLVDDDLELITEALVFYSMHMEPIEPLINTGLRKSKTVPEIIASYAWSKYAIVTTFSIVEGLMSKRENNKRPRLTDFIKQKMKGMQRPLTPIDIDKLSEEHQKTYPGSGERIKQFYLKNLPQGTIESIVREYRSWEASKKTFHDFDEVLEDLYGPIRSGFVHQMGREALQLESIVGNYEAKGELRLYSNLSLQELICFTWRAILNSFGYSKNVTFVN